MGTWEWCHATACAFGYKKLHKFDHAPWGALQYDFFARCGGVMDHLDIGTGASRIADEDEGWG